MQWLRLPLSGISYKYHLWRLIHRSFNRQSSVAIECMYLCSVSIKVFLTDSVMCVSIEIVSLRSPVFHYVHTIRSLYLYVYHK